MSPISVIRSGLLKVLFLCSIALALTACASRPKPLEPNRPVTVTNVVVTAENINDTGLALLLRDELNAKAGRATRDVGQPASLRVHMLSRAVEGWAMAITGGLWQTTTVDVVLSDAATGAQLQQRTLRYSATGRADAFSDRTMIARLVVDIRALLGLSGYQPYPVGGAKRDVAFPQGKPELIDPAYFVSDPLLNGTITPTTVDFEPEPQPTPAVDLSRPLLANTPATEATVTQSSPTNIVQQKAPVDKLKSSQVPANVSGVSPVTATPATEDEPCVVTLENDCVEPDSG